MKKLAYSLLFLLFGVSALLFIRLLFPSNAAGQSIEVSVSDINATPTMLQELPVAPPPFQPVKIAVVGDFGDPSPSPADTVASLIKSWNVDAVVTTGDNNYPNGNLDDFQSHTYAHYVQFIDKQMFFPTLGNHDWGYPDSNSYTADNLPSSQYFSYLPENRRYYSVVLGNGLVKIIVLDTDRREPDLAGQGSFLQQELSTGEPYKLVFTHEPPFSSCDGKDTSRSDFPYQEWGATALFSGHCHLYEHLVINGFNYVIQGAGGGGQTDNFGAIHPESVTRYNAAKGAVLVTADTQNLTVKFIDVNGTEIESFSIPAKP